MEHKDFLKQWFNELRMEKRSYEEPFLEEYLVDKIKLFCDVLSQDAHVFLSTVEVVEEYVRVESARGAPIADPVLVFITSILLCCKFNGEVSEFKTGSLVLLYEKVCNKSVSVEEVIRTEMSIYKTLGYRLPKSTRIDDLKIFLEYYMTPYKLKFSLQPLCVELLNFYTIHSRRIFTNLRARYLRNFNTTSAFSSVYTNRMYVPIGVLLSAINVSNARNVLNTKSIVEELSGISNIHKDHLNFLCDEIITVFGLRKKHNGFKV